MKEAHNTEITNINKIHQKNMEKISSLQIIDMNNLKEIFELYKIEKDLERKLLQQKNDPKETGMPRIPDEESSDLLANKPTHPNYLDPNRRRYAPPPPDPLDEPESYIISTFPPTKELAS